MICLAVTFVVKPGNESEAIAIFEEMTEKTLAEEPGCQMYLAHRSPTEPLKFFLYEQYDDQAALDAHRASPHFEHYIKNRLMPLIESRDAQLYEALI
jgi:quinol monooxygenase YgiN